MFVLKTNYQANLPVKLQGTFPKKEDESESETIKRRTRNTTRRKRMRFHMQKGIWDYEFIKSTNEVYKKGQYKIEEEITITAKE